MLGSINQCKGGSPSCNRRNTLPGNKGNFGFLPCRTILSGNGDNPASFNFCSQISKPSEDAWEFVEEFFDCPEWHDKILQNVFYRHPAFVCLFHTQLYNRTSGHLNHSGTADRHWRYAERGVSPPSFRKKRVFFRDSIAKKVDRSRIE